MDKRNNKKTLEVIATLQNRLFNKVMPLNPYEYLIMDGIKYAECPFGGDSEYLLAIDEKNELAVYTGFYDTGDFYEGSDYIFKLVDGRLTNGLNE